MNVKRVFDLLLALAAAVVLAVPVMLVAVLVRLTSLGPALYWSDRVGRHNKIFKIPKFRSMRVGTPAVATHLLDDAKSHLTPIGYFCARAVWTSCPNCGASWPVT
jgi:O-antigen biosynthesis protein WbqP